MDYNFGSSQAVQTMGQTKITGNENVHATIRGYKPPRKMSPRPNSRTKQPLSAYVAHISCPTRKVFYEEELKYQEKQKEIKKISVPTQSKIRNGNADNSEVQGDVIHSRYKAVGPVQVQSRVMSANQPAVPRKTKETKLVKSSKSERGEQHNNDAQAHDRQEPKPKPTSPKSPKTHFKAKRRKNDLSVSDVMHVDIRPSAKQKKNPHLNPTHSPTRPKPTKVEKPHVDYPRFSSNNRKSLPLIHRISSFETQDAALKSNLKLLSNPKYAHDLGYNKLTT